MSLLELALLAVGLSMDAFAVSICIGLASPACAFRTYIVPGLYFGVFQAVMPLIGYFAATWFADSIIAYDHWAAFGLLCFLGGKMIVGSFKKDEQAGVGDSLSPKQMLPLAIATSIDALAVGVSFAFLSVSIIPAVLFIGFITLVISIVGVKIGSVFGVRFKSRAEIAGGIILILIGLKVPLEHMGILSF